jgi:hypothetical protein
MALVEHSQLRDLIWAVCSPPMIAPLHGWPAAFSLDKISDIQQRLTRTDVIALERHLAACETRFLGSYFEALWDFYFQHDPRFTVVAKNLQIRDRGNTLVEFDFIVYDHEANKHLQLELAIKFYLGVSERSSYRYTDGKHLWIGPQARDRLDKKLSRALEHQLKLHKHPRAQQRLQELGVNLVEPQLLFKGYLFQPQHALPLPDYVPRANYHAQWLRLDETPKILGSEHSWFLLHKRHWPAPPYMENLSSPLTGKQLSKPLSDIIERENRPYMIVQLDGADASESALKRYFVTPNRWPQIQTSP